MMTFKYKDLPVKMKNVKDGQQHASLIFFLLYTFKIIFELLQILQGFLVISS
jgi:hypothetical protein